MFCPSCKDEFRAGFTHCANCDVDLVDSLEQAQAGPPMHPGGQLAAPVAPVVVRMAEYCGFFDLEEAREGRDALRAEGLITDILIREAPDSEPSKPVREEFWLRVDVTQLRRAAPILGHDQESVEETEQPAEGDSFNCSACGQKVAAAESFCPGCGLRFEGD